MADRDSRTGTRYGDEALYRYVDEVHAAHDAALAAAFDAPDEEGMPAIQVVRSEGKFLDILVRLSGARRIVEVGTLAGYSALRMARAMPEDGHLWTVEFDPKHAEVARQRIAAAGMSDRVDVCVGAGLDVLPTLDSHGPFDLVFVDADKENYAGYGAWARNSLRPGGLLIGDNAYLFGNLMDDSERGRSMRTFHEEAAEYFDSVCVPTPDGMLIGIKR